MPPAAPGYGGIARSSGDRRTQSGALRSADSGVDRRGRVKTESRPESHAYRLLKPFSVKKIYSEQAIGVAHGDRGPLPIEIPLDAHGLFLGAVQVSDVG